MNESHWKAPEDAEGEPLCQCQNAGQCDGSCAPYIGRLPVPTMTTERALDREALAPCPFCGSTELVVAPAMFGHGHTVSCDGCTANLMDTAVPPFHSRQRAIAAWNRRAPVDAPAPLPVDVAGLVVRLRTNLATYMIQEREQLDIANWERDEAATALTAYAQSNAELKQKLEATLRGLDAEGAAHWKAHDLAATLQRELDEARAREAEAVSNAVHAAALKWCGEKERETFPEDIEYFEHNWRSFPGLRSRVECELGRAFIAKQGARSDV